MFAEHFGKNTVKTFDLIQSHTFTDQWRMFVCSFNYFKFAIWELLCELLQLLIAEAFSSGTGGKSMFPCE